MSEIDISGVTSDCAIDMQDTRQVCLFGAALDTSNLGVSALCRSVLLGFRAIDPRVVITTFDHSRGAGDLQECNGDKAWVTRRCGAYHTKRVYRRESLWNIRLSAMLGGFGNPGAKLIRSANAILDISGGDSFTDMYGAYRFRAVTLAKLIALEQRKPLILLPQTYGPFRESSSRRTAQNIVRASAMAWARDRRSFDVLKELLGQAFDPTRHRLGVDVAFGLPEAVPEYESMVQIQDMFARRDTPIVGLNVSGLLFNCPTEAAQQYGLKADYPTALRNLVQRFLRDSDARIVLVPHVMAPPIAFMESDIKACRDLAANLADDAGDRIAVMPLLNEPSEVKWVISQCDWFCGTRMHSTIAALSSGVPAAAISYSPKTLGVFESCGQGEHVADPRMLDTNEVIELLWQSWQVRDDARKSLDASLPFVLQQAELQMREIFSACFPAWTTRTSRGR